MPNAIKYSTTGDTLSLKKGNIFFGVGDVGKGPSSATTYYNGVTPPSGGYTIYSYNVAQTSRLSFHTAANDSALITYTNGVSGQNFSTATQCLNWYATQSNYVCVNSDYEGIVTNGLVMNVDAGFIPSYPTNGTTWYDLSYGGTNVTLINGPTYNSSNNGSIVFDGGDDSSVNYSPNLSSASGTKTVLCWCWPDSTGPSNQYTGLVSWGGRGNDNPSSSLLLSLNTNASTWYVGSAYWYNDYVPDTLSVNKNAWNMVGIIARQQSVPNSNNTTLICGNSGGLNYSTGNSSDVNRSINTLNVNLAIGSTDIVNRAFKGRIANVLIYNRELTTAEILQNFNAQKSRFGL
jgi:hypothetical protein